jgi:glutaredoxin
MVVKIYSREDCSFCQQAKEFLTGFEIDYIVENQPTGQVPQIYAGEKHIGGYTELVELSQSITEWEETFNV